MMKKLLSSAVVSFACVVSSTHGQISFTNFGTGTNYFSALPTLSSGWSTLSVMPSSQTNIMTAEELDLAAQTNSASAVSTALTSSSTVPPSANAIARWNSVNLNLQSRASGNSYTLLMATLRNNTGIDLSGITVSYDYTAIVAADGSWIQEEVPGYMTYYSLSGAPGSWVLIPELSTNGNPAAPIQLTSTLELNPAWAAGSNLYLLWADDNAMAGGDTAGQAHEGCYTIDNFSAKPVAGGPLSVRVAPDNVVTTQCSSVVLTAHIMGGNPPYAYQWFSGNLSSPILNETNTDLVLTNVQLSQAGEYLVEVTDSTTPTPQTAQSNSMLTVIEDTTLPVLLSALGETNLRTIVVTFSKPVQLGSSTGADFAVQALDGTGPLSLTSSVSSNGTDVILTTAQPRELKNYTVGVQGTGVRDLCNGQSVPDTVSVPLTGQIVLVGLADNTLWHYRDDGVDPGPDWMQPGIDLTAWSSGAATFDGKRGSNRVYITASGIDVPVQTHLALTNANYQGGVADIPSYYFRKTFTFSGDPTNSSLRLWTFFDDSGVVFLNGQEVWRRRVTNDLSGQLSFDLYCPLQPSTDAAFEGPFSIPLTNIMFGENLLAVCLKQANTNSSDITMALGLMATVTNFATGPLQVRAAMTPASGIVNQCGTASFEANVIGGNTPYFYQWYKNNTNSPVSGANGPTLVLSNVQPAEAGSYFVVVTDSSLPAPQTVECSASMLQVVPEIGGPVLVSALGDTNLHTIVAGFSKPIQISSATGGDFRVEAVDGSGDLTVSSSMVTNGTNVLLTTVEARQFKDYKVVVQGSGVNGCAGPVADGSFVPLAAQIVLIGLSDNTLWRCRGDGIDPGPNWMAPGINLDNWFSALAVFDGKRDSNRTYITVETGEEVPIQSHLELTNVNYQAGASVIPSYYFRAQFAFPGDPNHSSLSLVTFFDDSGVVFLNGEEAWRLRVTNDLANQLSFDLYCPRQPSSDAALEGPFNLPLTNVVAGENLIAVCLKQVNATSSDITMGLSLVATVTNFAIARPTLIILPVSAGQVEVSWAQSGIAFELQSAANLGDPEAWGPVAEADNPSGGYHRVTVNISPNGVRFFRLYKP